MSNFRKVKNAFVILDVNQKNHLYVEFEEFPEHKVYDRIVSTVPIGEKFYYDHGDGLVDFGCRDINDEEKIWSSRPDVFNTPDDRIACIDYSLMKWEPVLGTYHMFSAAMRVDFCHEILEEFCPDFECIKCVDDWGTEITYNLFQKEVDLKPGEKFTAIISKKPQEVIFVRRIANDYHDERFIVNLNDGSNNPTRYLSYNDMPQYYKGYTWEKFQEWIKKNKIADGTLA